MEDFLKVVLRSGLLNERQLEAALRRIPAHLRADPLLVADHLVKNGRLSHFQATKLLQGKTRGLILGPYHILAPIGRGGMSRVYLARDRRQSRQLVALKVLPPKIAKREERLLARFQREMDICQRVKHPNLAQTFEVGVSQDIYYIALEFIPGRSLYRLVKDKGPLDTRKAAQLFTETAAALEHAHGVGLIHRDLKPSNIMVTPQHHAKLLDLGLAIIQGEIPPDRTIVGGQGYIVGTMDYLPPEQSEDPLKVDARADIYALGCTIYFALSGRPPFPGGTALQKILRHRAEEPEPLQKLVPRLPEQFVALVRKMMAKNPDDRFASAAEVRSALETWFTPVATLTPPEIEEAGRQDDVADFDLENDDGSEAGGEDIIRMPAFVARRAKDSSHPAWWALGKKKTSPPKKQPRKG